MSSLSATGIGMSAGLLYLLMAGTVWGMLRRGRYTATVHWWSLGSLLAGLGLMLTAGRDHLPIVLSYGLAGLLTSFSLVLHVQALRRHLGLPDRRRRMALVALAVSLLYFLLPLTADLRQQALVNSSLLVGGLAVLLWHTEMAYRRIGTHSLRLLSWSAGLLLLFLMLRMAMLAGGAVDPSRLYLSWDYTLVMLGSVQASLYSNLGFLGMVLDITRKAETRARELQALEATRREVAEQTADELRQLLQQRDALAQERERLLQLLAHEIRQPLHNASGALQAASQALRSAPLAGLDQVTQRLGRAESVLCEVRSVLDNTLTAATLLSRSTPLVVQEVDLDFLIDLALGDLDESQRCRVQVVWHTDLRQAEVEPGLLRLALRNLLANAFGHGGPDVAVQLQVAEQDQPPALLLRVVDNGVGMGQAKAALSNAERRPGLGLAIVQQVVALHSGRLDLQAQIPHGVQAVLTLPLPAP